MLHPGWGCKAPWARLAELFSGAPGRNRTCDQEIRRLLLYPLSYEGKPVMAGNSSLPSKQV